MGRVTSARSARQLPACRRALGAGRAAGAALPTKGPLQPLPASVTSGSEQRPRSLTLLLPAPCLPPRPAPERRGWESTSFPCLGESPPCVGKGGGGGRKGRIKELFCCRGAWYTATVKPRELEAIVKKSLKSVSFHSVLRERFKFCAS